MNEMFQNIKDAIYDRFSPKSEVLVEVSENDVARHLDLIREKALRFLKDENHKLATKLELWDQQIDTIPAFHEIDIKLQLEVIRTIIIDNSTLEDSTKEGLDILLGDVIKAALTSEDILIQRIRNSNPHALKAARLLEHVIFEADFYEFYNDFFDQVMDAAEELCQSASEDSLIKSFMVNSFLDFSYQEYEDAKARIEANNLEIVKLGGWEQ